MFEYYKALKAYAILVAHDAKDEYLDATADDLKKAFMALEEWEQDLLRETCNAEICDIIFY